MNIQIIRRIISQCTFPGFRFIVEGEDAGPIKLVIEHHGTCNMTGTPLTWRSRKWLLSRHMVPSEVVQTAFLAIQTAMEHEAREQFKYRGAAVFGPHFNVERLVALANDPLAIEERTSPANDEH